MPGENHHCPWIFLTFCPARQHSERRLSTSLVQQVKPIQKWLQTSCRKTGERYGMYGKQDRCNLARLRRDSIASKVTQGILCRDIIYGQGGIRQCSSYGALCKGDAVGCLGNSDGECQHGDFARRFALELEAAGRTPAMSTSEMGVRQNEQM